MIHAMLETKQSRKEREMNVRVLSFSVYLQCLQASFLFSLFLSVSSPLLVLCFRSTWGCERVEPTPEDEVYDLIE